MKQHQLSNFTCISSLTALCHLTNEEAEAQKGQDCTTNDRQVGCSSQVCQTPNSDLYSPLTPNCLPPWSLHLDEGGRVWPLGEAPAGQQWGQTGEDTH